MFLIDTRIFVTEVVSELMKDGAMMTILSTLMTALAVPATLVSAADLIDSQWAIAIDRLVFQYVQDNPLVVFRGIYI